MIVKSFEHSQGCSSSESERGLKKRKLCARFVPHFLTTEKKEDRVTSCQDIIAMADAYNSFLIITEIENWCFTYDPETKRQNSESVGETSPRPQKLKFQRSRIKTMLMIFFESQSLVGKEFVPEKKNSNCRIL